MTDVQHLMLRVGLLTSAVALGLMLFVAVADAGDTLPGGVTCEQVVRYASDLGIPNTWRGRVQAKLIALTFGMYLTNAQLDAAARCIREHNR